MKRRKLVTIASAVIALCALTVVAATYQAISLPLPGEWTPAGVGIGKAQAITCEGSAVAAGTVIISRISTDSATTNTLLTVTNSSGAVSVDLSSEGIWIKAGDRLLRSGTATNGPVILIVEQ